MENFIKEHDYAILVYAKEDTAKYTAAIKALTETKKMSGWDRVQGVTIHKDCRIQPKGVISSTMLVSTTPKKMPCKCCHKEK